MILDDLPPDLRPTVQVIDDWVTNRKLGLVFEAKVGKGKLLVCSIDLKNDLDQNPVARQMRHSLLDYMAAHEVQALSGAHARASSRPVNQLLSSAHPAHPAPANP